MLAIVLRNPVLVIDILQRKHRGLVRAKLRQLEKGRVEKEEESEVYNFISSIERTHNLLVQNPQDLRMNKLCHIEDWDNQEVKEIVNELQSSSLSHYIDRRDWPIGDSKVVARRTPGLIHRKDWEWALGIIAMKEFNKLNKNNVALGVGTGREEVLFYLANKLQHVYATDIYDGKVWNNYSPVDFPENPEKYAPFPYAKESLTALRMDATNLGFPSDTFDIAFSFSSIEHFGGDNHAGALKSLKEIERVLKKGGIAVVTTEFILNDKNHVEFFNKETIYSDLIDKLCLLKLVQPLDIRITAETLESTIDYQDAVYWDTCEDNEFRKAHPLVLIRVKDMLVTSIILVFKKK